MTKQRRRGGPPLPAPPVNFLRCAWCPSPLIDQTGQLRFDLFTLNGTWVAVCYGGCRRRTQQPHTRLLHASQINHRRASVTTDAVLAGAGRA